ncbi:MAG: signal peptidase I [Bacilli bacterium]|nr:signal peptidase I [Bacilli bacterium]
MFLSILLFGFRKDNANRLKKLVLYKTIIMVIAYFLITYLCGLVIGFNKNVYSTSPLLLINNIFMPIVIVIGTEIYRYVVCSTRSKSEIVITTIALTIFEIFISMRFRYLLAVTSAFKYTTIIIIPIIIKNIFLTYLTKHGGLRSTIVYRLLIDTYILFVPLVPAFSDYLNSMIKICLPILSFIYISITVDSYNEAIVKNNKKSRVSIVNIFLISVLIIFIYLVSGIFTYTILGVASNSMLPTISKGDAVIIRKLEGYRELKVGDVIAYNNSINGKIIIHRIVEIKKDDNKEKIYVTKGDANKSVDTYKVTYKKIKGVVRLKIKYIAIPSIYLKELSK